MKIRDNNHTPPRPALGHIPFLCPHLVLEINLVINPDHFPIADPKLVELPSMLYPKWMGI